MPKSLIKQRPQKPLLAALTAAILMIGCPMSVKSAGLKFGQNHPDGSLGNLAIRADYAYSSVSGDSPLSIGDFQEAELKLNWVAKAQIVPTALLWQQHRDSFQYRLLIGLKYYVSNPMNPEENLNHDGAIGRPVLSLELGPGFVESGGDGSMALRSGLTWPYSKRLSLHVSYNYFSRPTSLDIDQGSVGVTLYPQRAQTNRPYLNPDGPMGKLLLHLEAGGGSRGWFGQLGFGLPFDQHWTIHSCFRYTEDSQFSRKILSAAIRFSLYPGSVFAETH
ncbi:MAG: hypothetical protein P1R58_04690 [bacterium]|nr:hypothetical protein [bacterium]